MRRLLTMTLALAMVSCIQPRGAITDFEGCVLAGYPVMESYPRRCSVPGGPTFTEEIPPVPQTLEEYSGTFLGFNADEVEGETRFKIQTKSGVLYAVLEPDAQVISLTSSEADLHETEYGTTLNVQGWSDEDKVLHAVKVRIMD